MRMLAAFISALACAVPAVAAEQGNAKAGLEFAMEFCSSCHAVAGDFSPLAAATPFREVAERPGMTGTALAVFLQTSHPTMPNFVLEKQDMFDVIAYIQSLKEDRPAEH